MVMTPNTHQKQRRQRNDIFLIVALLAVAVIGIACLFLFRRPGGEVVIYYPSGREYGRYPLGENRVISFTGESADHSNTVVIHDGQVYMESASCPDQLCVKHRPVAYVGETIVCLPHRVVVKIEGNTVASLPDTVA